MPPRCGGSGCRCAAGCGALYLGLLLFVVSVTGVGLMISSLAATQQQALLGAFLFMVPSIILSGFATPIANMPAWVQDLTLLNPMRYFLVIVRAVFLEGAAFPSLAWQYLADGGDRRGDARRRGLAVSQTGDVSGVGRGESPTASEEISEPDCSTRHRHRVADQERERPSSTPSPTASTTTGFLRPLATEPQQSISKPSASRTRLSYDVNPDTLVRPQALRSTALRHLDPRARTPVEQPLEMILRKRVARAARRSEPAKAATRAGIARLQLGEGLAIGRGLRARGVLRAQRLERAQRLAPPAKHEIADRAAEEVVRPLRRRGADADARAELLVDRLQPRRGVDRVAIGRVVEQAARRRNCRRSPVPHGRRCA